MTSLKVDFDLHFQASGPVDVPAGAEMIFGDDGQYVGYVGADGQRVAHRGFEALMAAAPAPAAPEPPAATITITPAPEPTPEPDLPEAPAAA